MFFILTNSFLAFLFCYHASNSRWRPIWLAVKSGQIRKSHISAQKYDKSINEIIRYTFLTLTNSFLAFLFCYHTSNLRWRPIWRVAKSGQIWKSHISAQKYDKSINEIIRYTYLTFANSFLAFLFCYHTSNSRWRPIWLQIWSVKSYIWLEKAYISQKNTTKE